MPEHKKGVVPRLRFPEFRDAEEWKLKRLGKCLEYQQPTLYLVSDANYSDSYNIPVLTAGKTFLLGYTNEKNGVFREPLPVIIFDDFTTATKFVDFPFKVKSSALKILQAKEGINIRFMYELMQMISYEVGAHERHWISKFQPMFLPIPQSKEQQKIADCLSSLDEVIELEAQKLEAFKTHKKGLMQQLFPREGETTPRLRFPEFRDAGPWEVKRLGEICSAFSGGTPSSSIKEYYGGSIPFIRSAEINQDTTELFLTEEGLKNSSAKLVVKGDILIALYGANSGDGALSKIDGAINQAILCLRSKLNHSFILAYWRLRKNEIVMRFIQGGQGNLSAEIVKSIAFAFPSLAEQQKIADCFSSLDRVIELEVQKLEALKAHKKGLLQQLFPQEVD